MKSGAATQKANRDTLAPEPQSVAPPPSVAVAVAGQGKSLRILLAEDVDVNQFVVTETLGREGYSCKIANNGREALDARQKAERV